MRVLDLALKDLSQILRDKMAFLFLAGLPIVFTFFMGFAFRGAASAPDPRLPVGWVNEDYKRSDDGSVSQALYDMLAASDGIRLVEMGGTAVEQAAVGGGAEQAALGVGQEIESGQLVAALVVPPDFSARVTAGEQASLTLLGDELDTAAQSALQLVRVPVTRLMSAAHIARVNVETMEAEGLLSGPSERSAEWTTTFSQTVQAWQTTSLAGPHLRVEKAQGQSQAGQALGGNPYNQSSPGILVQFAIMGLVTSASILVEERKTGTLQRLITTAIKPWQIIAGHLLAMFVLVLSQQALLIAFGQLALGVNYMRQPLAVLLVAVGLGAWISGMGLLIGVVAKGDEQVILFSLIAMFLFTSLGGAWFPLEGSGPAFAAVGHVTPAAWAMDGFQNIIIRGLGLRSVLLPTAVLLAYAAGFFALAVWRFRAGRVK